MANPFYDALTAQYIESMNPMHGIMKTMMAQSVKSNDIGIIEAKAKSMDGLISKIKSATDAGHDDETVQFFKDLAAELRDL